MAGRKIFVVGEYPPLVVLHEWHSVFAALYSLANRMVRHIPVVNDDWVLRGIFSIRDMLSFLACETWEKLRSKYNDDLFTMLSVVKISEVMTPNPYRLYFGEFGLRDAIETLAKYDVGALPVVERDSERLIGIVSEEMIARLMRLAAVGATAEEVMTSPVYTVDEEATVYDAIRLMCERKIRHVPIVDREGKPIAILSARDITRYLAIEEVIEKLQEKSIELFREVRALSISSRLLVAVEPDTPINQVAARMAMHGVSSVLVVEGDVVKGIVTDRDLVKKLPAKLGEILYDTLEQLTPSITM